MRGFLNIFTVTIIFLVVVGLCSAETYYDILGVKKDADEKTIKKKYYKLAKQHHPDKAGAEGTTSKDEELIAKINTAYETLSDSKKRKEYDNELIYGKTTDGYGNSYGYGRGYSSYSGYGGFGGGYGHSYSRRSYYSSYDSQDSFSLKTLLWDLFVTIWTSLFVSKVTHEEYYDLPQSSKVIVVVSTLAISFVATKIYQMLRFSGNAQKTN